MRHHVFMLSAGIIFLIAALLHGFRAFNGWELMYNGWMVPIWLSWVVALFAFLMAFSALSHLR